MAHTDHVDPDLDEALHQVVHCQVRGSGGEDLLAASRRAPDQLDEDGRLSRARRTVHEHEIFGALRQIERGLLLRIEVRCDSRLAPGQLLEPRLLPTERRMPAADLAHPPDGGGKPVVRRRGR